MSQAPAAASAASTPERGLAISQYLSFRLAERIYAIPLGEVAEITPNLPLNRMPHMPRSVEGLLDLRGQVLPVINLRQRLGFAVKEGDTFENILVVELGAQRVGLLVDAVESVATDNGGFFVPASPLLAGPEGAWVKGFLKQDERVVAVLDTQQVTTYGHGRARETAVQAHDADQRLDESLQRLIALAPLKAEAGSARIIPQMETAISHSEEEMAKVLDRVEGMMARADAAFAGLARLKQEVTLGHLKGEELAVAEIERIGQHIQDELFNLIQQVQYQDIVRQKLERVLNHLRGLQMVVGGKFRDLVQRR